MPDLACDALPRLNTDEVTGGSASFPFADPAAFDAYRLIRPEPLKEIRILKGGPGEWPSTPLLVLDEYITQRMLEPGSHLCFSPRGSWDGEIPGALTRWSACFLPRPL